MRNLLRVYRRTAELVLLIRTNKVLLAQFSQWITRSLRNSYSLILIRFMELTYAAAYHKVQGFPVNKFIILLQLPGASRSCKTCVWKLSCRRSRLLFSFDHLLLASSCGLPVSAYARSGSPSYIRAHRLRIFGFD